MKHLSLLLGVVVMGVSLVAGAEDLKLKTPRGVEIIVSINAPSNTISKAPAVIIASGQGYHKDLPLLKQFAEKLSADGFVAIRFNWNYYSSDPTNGQPSTGLKNEIEDMQTVINFAKIDSRVDADKIILAGKSLGTRISYSIFAKDEIFSGLILLTPICTDSESGKPIGAKSYPNFSSKTKPIVLVLGNADPLCSLPMLYSFIKSSKNNVSVAVFAGGHSLTFGKPGEPKNVKRDANNIEAAVHAAVQWANIIVGK